MLNSILFGDNYTGSDMELNGCVNDINYWESVYRHPKVKATNITRLTGKSMKRSLMDESLREILDKTPDQGLLYLNYSGHGTIVPPGIQSWVPDDFDWDNPKTWFTYDNLDQIFMQHEKRGVLVVVTSDSCHSKADPRKKFRNLGNPHPIKNRFLPAPAHIERKIVSDPFNRNILSASQDDLLLSGCRREQTSADAWINNSYKGAFTHAQSLSIDPYLKGLVKDAPTYYGAILKSRAWLATNGYDQVCSVDGDPKITGMKYFTPLPAKRKYTRKKAK